MPGDTVAVSRDGCADLRAGRGAIATRVEQDVFIHQLLERLDQVRRHLGAKTIDIVQDDVLAELNGCTGGCVPKVCIEEVGVRTDGTDLEKLDEQVERWLRLRRYGLLP